MRICFHFSREIFAFKRNMEHTGIPSHTSTSTSFPPQYTTHVCHAMPPDYLTILRGWERRVPFPHPPWMRSLSSPLDNYERQGFSSSPATAVKSHKIDICIKHGRPAFDKDYCCWIFSAPFPQTEIKLQLFMACFFPSCLITIPSPVCNCAWMRVPRHPVIHPCMWFAECALQQRYRNLFIMKRQSEVSAEKFCFAKGRRNAQNHCRLRNLYSGWQGTDWWTGLPFSHMEGNYYD